MIITTHDVANVPNVTKYSGLVPRFFDSGTRERTIGLSAFKHRRRHTLLPSRISSRKGTFLAKKRVQGGNSRPTWEKKRW